MGFRPKTQWSDLSRLEKLRMMDEMQADAEAVILEMAGDINGWLATHGIPIRLTVEVHLGLVASRPADHNDA